MRQTLKTRNRQHIAVINENMTLQCIPAVTGVALAGSIRTWVKPHIPAITESWVKHHVPANTESWVRHHIPAITET